MKIEVWQDDKKHILEYNAGKSGTGRSGKSLLRILQENRIYMPAVCAGRGNCGKCGVRVLKGEAPVSEADRRFFSDVRLQEGWRLACKLIPAADMKISLERFREAGMEVVGAAVTSAQGETEHSGNTGQLEGQEGSGNEEDKTDAELCEGVKTYLLGIDIGTTTIAMALLNQQTGQVVGEYLTVNEQRMYGADVISRIQASVEGKGPELQQCIRGILQQGIAAITANGAILPEKIVIAGNTTMIHLLMGYPCDTLGVHPFTPYHIGEIQEMTAENIPVHILPGITTFVGADIVSGMLVCKMAESSKISMLIDLGTNGEMAVGNQERILVTSTAAGPAFEGGNIVHGTGSIPGAVCNVKIKDGSVQVETIQGKPPVGICGTGTMEALYELLQAGVVDENGYMEQEKVVLCESEDGSPICFYQEDVRELQLAKAAVRAGIETLLLRYGVTAADVDTVYLAGGFGYHVNVEKAVGIGLLPEEFASKIRVIGNGSLQGTFLYGREESARKEAARIVELSEEIGLAADPDFGRLYMDAMFFD